MAIGGLSNTYDFAPSLGECGIYAYGMIGLRRAALLQEHMWTLRMAANMLLGRWSAQTPNLWSVDLQTVELIPGQTTYTVPANTVAILDAYVVQGNSGATVNRLILPISRSEYASYPQPNQIGQVTVFWFDRLLSPTITFYFAPDESQTQVQYYRVRQSMDANLPSGQQVELPYYWLESFALGLAHRLAISYAPDKAAGLKALADEAYAIAADQNVETSQTFISPIVSGYWRA